MLERAIEIAVKAHKGQLDKAGVPYVLHPLRMMLRMETEDEKLVALLHDVIEDSPVWSLQRLHDEGFSKTVLEAIDCITRHDTEPYDDLIDRVIQNSLARRVKIADLEDNMNVMRIVAPTEKDWERLKKYHSAWTKLKHLL